MATSTDLAPDGPTAAALAVEVPVHVLDEGRLLNGALKRWWSASLRAQRNEIKKTLGQYEVIKSLDALADLEAPSVLVVPVVAGGVVGKGDWWAFQAYLWQYVRRGGVVVALWQAFCLAQEGEKAGGRAFEGISTRAGDGWLPGEITLRRPGEDPPQRLSAGPLPSPLPRAITIASGHGFWVEHAVRDPRVAGPALETVASVTGAGASLPLALRLAYPAHDYPGAILFMNTWSWMRYMLDETPRAKAVKATDRAQAEFFFTCLRALNRDLVREAVVEAGRRARVRTRRLELLCGERDRLRHAMGGEKDYHRLLANDVELLLDLLAGRDDALLGELRALYGRGAPWPEPPHEKGPDRKGRLDILLVVAGEDVERSPAALKAYLARQDRRPVAWIELEAHAIDLAQMNNFTDGMKGTLRAGDFVCAVDRSSEDDPAVRQLRARIEARGARFIHVQVPEVFDRLEERYLPEIHTLQRRRYTVDVIRGLLG